MKNLTVAVLESVLTPALAALGVVFWGCQLEFQKRVVIRVFIDKPLGVTVEDCTQATHHIKAVLAVEVKGLEDYVLEVSSPGMDRQLFRWEQYQGYLDSDIKLRLRRPLENQRNFQGKLVKAENNVIQIHTDKGLISVEFENIDRAHVVPNLKIEGKRR